MKFVVVWLLVAIPLTYLFGKDEYSRFATHKAIAESPAFTAAAFDKLVQVSTRRNTSYFVRYKYTVTGREYSVVTTSTDQQGAIRYMAQANPQVAYSTLDPSRATLKQYYDRRGRNEKLWQVLTAASILPLGMSLPISYGFVRLLGWLRRKRRKDM
jgi:hypothetical protein